MPRTGCGNDSEPVGSGAGAAPLVVYSGGWERCGSDRVVELDSDQFCLELVVTGRGTLQFDGTSQELRPGAVLFFGPGDTYQRRGDEAGPICRYFVCFGGSEALVRMGQAGFRSGVIAYTDEPGRLQLHLQEFIQNGVKGESGNAETALFHLEALISAIPSLPRAKAPHAKGAYLTFLRCKTYLEEHYIEIRRLEEVAARFGINPSYLCRLFARFAKESPHQLYERLRINHAAHVLATRRVLVQEVAEALGMDQFHFSRVFKRGFGVSPSAFVAQRAAGEAQTPDPELKVVA